MTDCPHETIGRGSKEQEVLIRIPESVIRGTAFSPHTISFRPLLKPEEREGSSPHHPTLPHEIQRDHQVLLSQNAWKKVHVFRELRRMVFLGSIFIVLLWCGKIWSEARSYGSRLLREKDTLLQEYEDLDASLSKGDLMSLEESFRSFSLTLERLSLEKPLPEDGRTDGVVSGFDSMNALVEAGLLLSDTALFITDELAMIKEDIPGILSGELDLLTPLGSFYKSIETVKQNLQDSEALLVKSLRGPLPDDIAVFIHRTLQQIDSALVIIDKMDKARPGLEAFVGKSYTHTVVVVFQNSSELRPSGGFMGSLLIIHFNGGKIFSWKFSDIYDFDGQLGEIVPPPLQFSSLSDRFYLRDANIYPDFPRSGEYIRWFLEKEKGPTADTVIAVHEGVLRDLVTLFGPIELAGVDYVFDGETTPFAVSYLVEAKIFGQGGQNSPKSILEDFLFELMGRASGEGIPSGLVPVLESWKNTKSVQAYSRDASLEGLFQELGISGVYFPEDKKTEFLGIIHYSLGGNKSDAFIHEDVDLSTTVNLSGEVFHSLSISRSHAWGEREESLFSGLFHSFGSPHMDEGALISILGKGANRDLMTLYLPKGSRIIRSAGVNLSDLEVFHDEKYSAYSFLFPSLSPGEAGEVSFEIDSPRLLDVKNGEVLSTEFLAQPGIHSCSFRQSFLGESGLSVEGTPVVEGDCREDIPSIHLVTR